MSNGNNNTLVLFDSITAQDLLSKAKVCIIVFFYQSFSFYTVEKKSVVGVCIYEKKKMRLI